MLEHESASANGRVRALNQKLEQARGANPPPTEQPAKIESLESLRQELPEVAAAIEDVVRARLTPPAPAASIDDVAAPGNGESESEEAKALRKLEPNWEAKLLGTDFQLWLGTQLPDYRQNVMSTGSAGVLTAAFADFDKARPTPAGDVQHKRAARAAASITPRGSARPAGATNQMSDLEVAEAEFNSRD